MPPQNGGMPTSLILQELYGRVLDVFAEQGVTPGEYKAAFGVLAQLCSSGEFPLIVEALFCRYFGTLDGVGPEGATPADMEGPLYVAGAPLLESPVQLARPEEVGERLVFSGSVCALDGSPLPGAVLDLWQAGADGLYAGPLPEHLAMMGPGVVQLTPYDPARPDFNLRCRVATDARGCFEVHTVRPGAEPIRLSEAGRLVAAALGRTAVRAAHFHVRLTHPGYQPLTTQLYFAGDPFLATDLTGVPNEALVGEVLREDSAAGADLGRYRCDFVLVPDAE